jgi:hypothetical protein
LPALAIIKRASFGDIHNAGLKSGEKETAAGF